MKKYGKVETYSKVLYLDAAKYTLGTTKYEDYIALFFHNSKLEVVYIDKIKLGLLTRSNLYIKLRIYLFTREFNKILSMVKVMDKIKSRDYEFTNC